MIVAKFTKEKKKNCSKAYELIKEEQLLYSLTSQQLSLQLAQLMNQKHYLSYLVSMLPRLVARNRLIFIYLRQIYPKTASIILK